MGNMTINTSTMIQVFIYLITFGITWGSITARLKSLEQKVEKHNSVVERTFRLEESTKSAHHRIDELREELKG